MNKEVVVWSLPNCVKCNQTMFWLDNHNIPYTEEDLTDTRFAEVLAHFKELGHTSAPIVEVIGRDDASTEPVDLWSGFNQAKLEEHFG